jgi:phage FluMu gp28-like protein
MNVAALPDVFLPYQQLLWQTILANQLTVVEKSRRTGFSWALGYVAASVAGAARSAGGQDVLYMGYEKDMTREFIDYVANAAKAFQIAASEVEEFVFTDPDRPEKAIGAFRIRFASGFEVIALPSVPRALRGKQGLVILDEAAFMDGLGEVLKAALALLIWGGKVVVVSTHDGETNPFNGLVNDVRSGRQKGALLRLTFDDALEQGLYQRICFTRGIEWTPDKQIEWRGEILAIYRDNADEELHVIPNPTSGVYLPGTLIEARSVDDIPVRRYNAPQGMAMWPEHVRQATVQDWCETELLPVLSKLDPDEWHALGEDFGRIRDLTVLWLLAVTRQTLRATRLVVELRGPGAAVSRWKDGCRRQRRLFGRGRGAALWLPDRGSAVLRGLVPHRNAPDEGGDRGRHVHAAARPRHPHRSAVVEIDPGYRARGRPHTGGRKRQPPRRCGHRGGFGLCGEPGRSGGIRLRSRAGRAAGPRPLARPAGSS